MTIITTKGERITCDQITIDGEKLRADGDAIYLEDVREIRDGKDDEMTVDNLTSDELLQLKESIYYGTDEIEPHIDKVDADGNELYFCSEAIPIEIVRYYFGHVDFVPEDFFCNI